MLNACSTEFEDGSNGESQASLSAAELISDSRAGIGFAQAVAAGEIEIESNESNAEPTAPETAAPSTQTSEPAVGAANPDTAPNAGNVSGTSDEVVSEPEVDQLPLASAEPDSSTQESPTVSPASLPTTPVTGTDNESTTADSNVSESGSSVVATSPNMVDIGSTDETESTIGDEFTSHTSNGFSGRILEDGSIQIQWEEESTARGYNVYRDGDYVLSVFDTQWTDTDTADEDYYYEIEAFDFADNLFRIATGLTVRVRGSGREGTNNKTGPGIPLDDYELVFSDEFEGNSLDFSKWDTSYIWGPDIIINAEEQYYVDTENDPNFGFDPFTFDGESMTINSVRTPEALRGKAQGQPYLSGVITSRDSFNFTYGYAEARARTPFGRGFWSAFWLLNSVYDRGDEPEIDIMEHIGHDQDVAYHTYHYYDHFADSEVLHSTESMPVTGIDFTSDFHTFGVDWRPGTLVFYVDGIETHRLTDSRISSVDMYVIANTAVGGWWPGSPDTTTEFPAEYEIDYIRVYQKVTPFDDLPLFNDAPSTVAPADSTLGTPPSRRPTFEQWPEGYPGRTSSAN